MAYLLASVATLLLLFIYVLHVDNSAHGKRLKRLEMVRSARSWKDAMPGDLARLEGVVEALAAPIVAPLSGKEAVWHQMRGFHAVEGGRGSDPIVAVSSVQNFRVSGPEGAVVVQFPGEPVERPSAFGGDEEPPRITSRFDTGVVIDLSETLRQFLAERDEAVVERDGFARQYVFEEILIEVGSPMTVFARKPEDSPPHAKPGASPFREGEAAPASLHPHATTLFAGSCSQRNGSSDRLG